MIHYAPVVLSVVAALMLALAVRDLLRHRRVTPAVKARLLIVCIFALVVIWILPHDFR